MNCNSVQNLLSAYIDGELRGTDSIQVRDHLNHCDSCREEFSGLQAVHQMLRSVSNAPEPPEFLEEKLLTRAMMPRKHALRGLAFGSVAFALILAFVIPAVNTQSKASSEDRLRDLTIRRELAREQMVMAGSDPTSGAQLVHLSSYESR